MQTCTLAVDIGASSGRHIAGTVQNGKITLQEVYRFENGVHRENGHLCWDIDTLAKEVVNGLKAAHDAGFAPATIGIDTWAVDFVLLDADNKCIGDAVAYRDERTEGIREITLTDVRLAAAVGGVIKLIGKAVKNGEHVSCTVAPMIVQKENLLSDVRDVFNAILVRGDAIGDVVFYGRGAGKLPTASAVLADVIDEVKHLKARKYLCWSAGAPDYAFDFGLLPARMLLRVRADADRKADLAAAFGDIEFVTCDALPQGELAFVTSAMTEKELEDALKAVSGAEPVRRLRLAEL